MRGRELRLGIRKANKDQTAQNSEGAEKHRATREPWLVLSRGRMLSG